MADSSITITTEVDDKQAVKQLEKINRAIEKLENNINKNEAARLPIVEQLREAQQEAVKTYEEIERLKAALAQSEQKTSIKNKPGSINADEFSAELEKQQAIKAEIAQQERLYATQNKTVQKLKAADMNLLNVLIQQKNELQEQKSIAGKLTKKITSGSGQKYSSGSGQKYSSGVNSAKEKLSGMLKPAIDVGTALSAANVSIKKGIWGLLKYGLGIRTIFTLVKKLKTYIKDAVMAFAEADPETKASINGLKDSLAQLKASWGAAFAPILDAVIPILQRLISWVNSAANAVASFIAALSGKGTYKKAIANTNRLASGLGGAADNAKELKKQLMGIDELNVMDDASSSATGGGSGGAGSAMTVEESAIEMPNWVGMMVNQIRAGDWYSVGTTIAEQLNGISWGEMASNLAKKVGDILKNAFDVTTGFAENVDWRGLGKKLFDSAWDSITAIDWTNLTYKLYELVGAAFGAVNGFFIGIFESLWENLKTAFKTAFDTYFAPYTNELGELTAEGVFLGILDMFADIANWIDENIFQPFITGFKNAFGIHSPSTVMQTMGEYIVDGLYNGLKDKWDTITNFFTEKLEDIKTKFEDLKTKFSTILEDIKNLFNFEFTLPKIKVPHLDVVWEPAGNLAKFFGISEIPNLSVSWYARGGIVDGATLIGAGEAGKEAIVPLERNTQWVGMVAKGLADILFGNGELSVIADHIADIPTAIDRVTSTLAGFTMPPLPAVAQGTLVPPNAMNGRYGLNEELSEKLSRFLDAFGAGGSSPINIRTEVMLDKRKVGESVYNYLNERERGSGA